MHIDFTLEYILSQIFTIVSYVMLCYTYQLKSRNKMVVIYHKINNAWTYPGGHADGEEDLLSVAVKEVKEETGLDIRVLDNNTFAIWSGPVKGHIKNG